MALELKMSELKLAPVKFNYEELKKEVAEKTLPYKGLIVEEDSIPVAKTDLANLRKLEKAIDDRRKAVKKEYNAPYMDFEAKIKDILSDIQEAEQNIDSQVKAFEKKIEDEKFAQIKRFYTLAFGELAKDVRWENVYNPKWLNKGYKMADIEEEIAAAANKLHVDIGVIQSMKSSHEASLMRTLFDTLDLGKVMVEHNALVELEERKKEEEEKARLVAEELAKMAEIEETTGTPITEVEPEIVVDTPKPLQRIVFWVEVNDEQKVAIGRFFRELGVRYGKA